MKDHSDKNERSLRQNQTTKDMTENAFDQRKKRSAFGIFNALN